MGRGCVGQLPGMGGVDGNANFIRNCAAWSRLYEECARAGHGAEIDALHISAEVVGIAPVTGAVQNIGCATERDFYLPYFSAAKNAGAAVCVGDGCPDEKLLFGLEAVRTLGVPAYFFLKPYPDERLRERLDWVRADAAAVGMDIDAYNIATMREQVRLERKSAAQIRELRRYAGAPFMLKGIFTAEDVALCREVRPDVAVVSNHGGRVDADAGSTADFLAANRDALRDCCGEIWVDGGIRTAQDVRTALFLGAQKALVGRPFISALCRGGQPEMERCVRDLRGICPSV